MTSEKNRKWWALSGLSMACLIGYLDFAIVNTALPEIQKELGVSFVVLQWVMNVFVLALSIFMVNMGRFGDTFGRRPMLYIGLVLFGIASLFSGLASNGLVLITFRALQGLGLAMIIPSSLALISDTFPESERGRAIGIWTSITGLGVALGPVLGGIITSALSWRWIFFVNIPILTIAAAICLISVKESVRGAGEKTIDWYGFFLMMIGIGALVSAIIQGPEWGWHSAMTILFFLISVISLVSLYIVENRVKSPIIDFKLFMSRGFLSGAFANFTLVAFGYSAFFLMPLYLGNILRKEAFEIGLLLLPITVLVIMVAPLAGKVVDSRGAKLPILAGLSALALNALIQSTYKPDSSLIYIVFGFLFMGLGWGSIFGSGAFAAISSLPKELAGTATGALWTFQNLGGSIGLAVAGVIFRGREKISLDSGLTGAGIELNPEQQSFIGTMLSDPENARHVLSQFTDAMSGRILPIFENAFMKGYEAAFIFLLCLSAGAFILIALIMKDVKRVKPGN
jgi:EmrB/QacA subfamily drug resistance transporter